MEQTMVQDANEQLQEHTCTEGYHKWLGGLLVTDGVVAMGEMFQCYWLLDIIASYQHELKNQPFQVWKMVRMGEGCTITCEDGNKGILKSQKVPYTDIQAETATIWVESGVALLPSEH